MHHISSIQPQIQCTHRTSMLHSSSHCQCQFLSISDQYMSQLLPFSHCKKHNVHWARTFINNILTWPVIKMYSNQMCYFGPETAANNHRSYCLTHILENSDRCLMWLYSWNKMDIILRLLWITNKQTKSFQMSNQYIFNQ